MHPSPPPFMATTIASITQSRNKWILADVLLLLVNVALVCVILVLLNLHNHNAGHIKWIRVGNTGSYWALDCEFPGNDMAHFPGLGETCGHNCTTTKGCSHFTWSPENGGTCFLKSGRVDPSMAIDMPQASCGYFDYSVQNSQQLTDVTGNKWSTWTSWSYCTVSCGGGTQTRNRTLMCSNTNGTHIACSNGTAQTATQTCHNFTCNCLTTSGSVGNASCVFPWTYSLTGSISYPACSTVRDTSSWCPTVVDSAGKLNSGSGTWGYCGTNCPRCLTVDGPVVGASCMLPFKYDNTTYNTCSTADNGANNGLAWCATGSDVKTQWGICDDSRLCPGGN